MRMRTDDRRHAALAHPVGQSNLARAWPGQEFAPPMHEGNHRNAGIRPDQMIQIGVAQPVRALLRGAVQIAQPDDGDTRQVQRLTGAKPGYSGGRQCAMGFGRLC